MHAGKHSHEDVAVGTALWLHAFMSGAKQVASGTTTCIEHSHATHLLCCAVLCCAVLVRAFATHAQAQPSNMLLHCQKLQF